MKSRLKAAEHNRIMAYMALDQMSKAESNKGSKSHGKTKHKELTDQIRGANWLMAAKPGLKLIMLEMKDYLKDYATRRLKEMCNCAE